MEKQRSIFLIFITFLMMNSSVFGQNLDKSSMQTSPKDSLNSRALLISHHSMFRPIKHSVILGSIGAGIGALASVYAMSSGNDDWGMTMVIYPLLGGGIGVLSGIMSGIFIQNDGEQVLRFEKFEFNQIGINSFYTIPFIEGSGKFCLGLSYRKLHTKFYQPNTFHLKVGQNGVRHYQYRENDFNYSKEYIGGIGLSATHVNYNHVWGPVYGTEFGIVSTKEYDSGIEKKGSSFYLNFLLGMNLNIDKHFNINIIGNFNPNYTTIYNGPFSKFHKAYNNKFNMSVSLQVYF